MSRRNLTSWFGKQVATAGVAPPRRALAATLAPPCLAPARPPGLALLGPLGSVDRAVAVMMMQRTTIFITYGLALFCLVLAGVTMSWVKMDGTGQGEIPGAITGVFALFIFGVLWKKEAMKHWFSIPMEVMTQGNVRLGLGANDLVRRSHRPSLLNAAPDVLRPRRVAGGVAPRGGGGFSRHRLLPRCVPVATPRPCRLHTHARALRYERGC